MHISHQAISKDQPPFIIAEMSGNHNQSLERALAIVDAAAQAGAHAVKLQTYTADSMTLDITDGEFVISDPASLWKGQALHSLYQQAYTPWEWHAPIMARARAHGLQCFSSPFDEAAVDFLETLDVPCYKIASFECVDLPLIRKVAGTGKPLLISTGMATIAEIAEAVDTARTAGCNELVLFKCTSTYPASAENSNLRTIAHMRELFGCEVGLSDHTLGIGAAVAAVAFGATVIEKHFTLDRAEGGVDAAFSLEPSEFAGLVTETERAWQALGSVKYGPTEAEEKARMRRRSLYIAEDLAAGDVLTPLNLRRIRPGHGLPPKFYDVLLGRKVTKTVKKGTPLTWELFE
ncbi:pseudaminic acid synthase [Methylomonas methanica]|uniref:Pseudaminic acid synthase n=1 Tax=Methylomonas methanica (strain DSM 25384 / MC09) TaxID=857087 RepID=F9ZZF0_METMM|nr:pseudaminic acid synthase [Methylomonas methanica]AEG02343.1 pseudaminic acid synthase [Methylomonas methanica MC09]